MNKTINFESLEAVYIYTLVFLLDNGAKEEVESTRRVAILPRDCE